MEVRIKEGNGYVDAEWTIEHGVMVVSPKEVKFEPKDGDILSCFFRDEYQGTFVFEEASECGEAIFHFALDADGKFLTGNGCAYFGYVYNSRPATEEKKKKLFDKLAEEGYSWDAERKELVKLKWKPRDSEKYFLPRCDVSGFHVRSFEWEDTRVEEQYYKKGWIYKTEQECQEFCDKLNQAISQVKP